MNVKLIALVTVTVALLSFQGSQAADKRDMSIYGNFRMALNKLNTQTGATVSTNGLEIVNNASRLGFMGGEKREKVSFHYKLELGAVNDDDTSGSGLTPRFYWGLVKTQYGQLMMGRLSTPYKMAGLQLDPFYDTSAGATNAGANFGLSSLTNGFTNDSLVYTSPKIFNYLNLTAGVYIDDADTDQNDYSFGAKLTVNSLNFQLHYLSTHPSSVIANSTLSRDALRFTLNYDYKNWNFGASFEDVDTDQKYLYVTVGHLCKNGLQMNVSYGSVDTPAAESTDGVGYSVGAFYSILDKTKLSAIASFIDNDDNVSHRDIFSVGIIHDFSWKFM
jgi:hypothetical protein